MTYLDLAGLRFYGDHQETPGLFQFSDFSDWYSASESKTPIRERAQGDGAAEIETDYRSAAVLSLAGWCTCETWEDALQQMRVFKRALNARRMVPIEVTDALGTTSRLVSVRRAPVRENPAALSFDFAIDMIAPDPNRYGPALAAGPIGLPTPGTGINYPISYPIDYGTAGNTGRLVITNDGDEETFSVLEVTGGLAAGFELTELTSGRTLRLDRAVPAGSTVFLDSRTRAVYIDEPENDISGFLTRRDWWPVPALGSVEIQFTSNGGVTGTPTLTARTAPAY